MNKYLMVEASPDIGTKSNAISFMGKIFCPRIAGGMGINEFKARDVITKMKIQNFSEKEMINKMFATATVSKFSGKYRICPNQITFLFPLFSEALDSLTTGWLTISERKNIINNCDVCPRSKHFDVILPLSPSPLATSTWILPTKFPDYPPYLESENICFIRWEYKKPIPVDNNNNEIYLSSYTDTSRYPFEKKVFIYTSVSHKNDVRFSGALVVSEYELDDGCESETTNFFIQNKLFSPKTNILKSLPIFIPTYKHNDVPLDNSHILFYDDCTY